MLALGISCKQETLHIRRFTSGQVKELWIETGRSQDSTVKDGVFQSFFPNHRLESKITYRNGRKNGLGEFWDRSGTLCFQGQYTDDFLIDEKRFNHKGESILHTTYTIRTLFTKALSPSGDSVKAIEKCAWTNPKEESSTRSGLCRLEYSLGSLLAQRYYFHGKLHGEVKAWYPNGSNWLLGSYASDVPTGIWKTWSLQGKLLWSANYSNGIKDGIWEEYFPSGLLKKSMVYYKGKRNGIFREYYPTGKLKRRGAYQEGLRAGPEKTWYPNGNPLYSAMYVSDRLQGPFQQWHRNCKIELQCHFRNNEKSGQSRVWNKHGQLIELATFKSGKLNGPYQSWTPDGKLISTKEFKGGTLTYDSKAKELLAMFGADQIRVPVGIFGFYWGMSPSACRSVLEISLATKIRSTKNEMTAHWMVFKESHPKDSRVRLQFNDQGELWGIKLDIYQKNSQELFSICTGIETELQAELGEAQYRKGEEDSSYFLTHNQNWGFFSVSLGTQPPITQDLSVIRAESLSPGNTGWFRFNLMNQLIREYTNPANASFTSPEWAEPENVAGR